MATVTKNQARRIHIGNAVVTSGMLMIVDPCFVLKPSPEMAKVAKEIGVKQVSDSFNTKYDVATDVCYEGTNLLDEMTPEQHRQIAYGTVCGTGRGDA
jgi:hypothetical protein